MEQFLTTPEVRVLNEFRHVTHDSMWGIAIRQTVQSNDPDEFRLLIKELKSQEKDNPPAMREILGSAYNSLVAIK